jgi:hypothetical protein
MTGSILITLVMAAVPADRVLASWDFVTGLQGWPTHGITNVGHASGATVIETDGRGPIVLSPPVATNHFAATMPFAVMWTNDTPGNRLAPGLGEYIVDQFLSQPNYHHIDGKPLLAIWNPSDLGQSALCHATCRLFGSLQGQNCRVRPFLCVRKYIRSVRSTHRL